jgi:hypothetical protein
VGFAQDTALAPDSVDIDPSGTSQLQLAAQFANEDINVIVPQFCQRHFNGTGNRGKMTGFLQGHAQNFSDNGIIFDNQNMHVQDFLTNRCTSRFLCQKQKNQKHRPMVLAVPSVFDNGKFTFPNPQITYA